MTKNGTPFQSIFLFSFRNHSSDPKKHPKPFVLIILFYIAHIFAISRLNMSDDSDNSSIADRMASADTMTSAKDKDQVVLPDGLYPRDKASTAIEVLQKYGEQSAQWITNSQDITYKRSSYTDHTESKRYQNEFH